MSVDPDCSYNEPTDHGPLTIDSLPCTTAKRSKQLVREKALKFGEFTLASGKKASYYLDCRQITLDAQGRG